MDQADVLQTFFGTTLTAGRRINRKFSNYLRFLDSERRAARPHALANRSAQRPTLITYEQLCGGIREIRANQSSTRAEIVQRLTQRHNRMSNDELQQIVELCMRVGLFLNVRTDDQDLMDVKERSLNWPATKNIGEFVTDQFPVSRWHLDAKDSRIHPLFSAAFMHKVCDLKLKMTNCLSNHLYLDRRREGNVLMVFPYKACLFELLSHTDWNARSQAQAQAGQGLGVVLSAVLPKAVLEETIQSLNLLFPIGDTASINLLYRLLGKTETATSKLLKEYGEDFHLCEPYNGPATLHLMDFIYWRDRLLELHDVVFSSPPVSWHQLWLDRRNPQLFWTFWLALFIAVLTVISTVASVYQAAKS